MNEDRAHEMVEKRLEALNDALPAEGDFAERVMARIRVDAGAPRVVKDYRLWRLVMKGTIGIAASVAMAAAVWHFSVGSPRVVYGLDTLPQRLLSLQSLHVKGTLYWPDGSSQPLELWAQRPNKLRVNGHLGNGPSESASTDQIISPEGRTTIDAEKKEVTISNERPVNAQLETEQFLQETMQMAMGSTQHGFTKVREEQIGSVKAAVYEGRMEAPGVTVRTEVALDPQSGLPLHITTFMKVQEASENKCMEMATIEPNVAIAPETFVFHPPADWQVNHVEYAGVMISQANSARVVTRYTIALNGRDTLMCWARYDSHNPTGDLQFPGKGQSVKIADESGAVCEERLLHADETEEGYHWRWSLVRSPTAKDFGRILTTTLQSHGSTTSGTLSPVQLPPEELEQVVEAAQRVTLAEGKTPMSVKEIEAAGK